jgi:hypothetical protein
MHSYLRTNNIDVDVIIFVIESVMYICISLEDFKRAPWVRYHDHDSSINIIHIYIYIYIYTSTDLFFRIHHRVLNLIYMMVPLLFSPSPIQTVLFGFWEFCQKFSVNGPTNRWYNYTLYIAKQNMGDISKAHCYWQVWSPKHVFVMSHALKCSG